MLENLGFYHAVSELIGRGGPFVFWIFAAGVLMWAIILERYLFFFSVLPKLSGKIIEQWSARKDHTSWCARQIRQMLISRANAAMTGNFPLMQVLVPLSPLLGLVGTVSGMLEVFDSMSLRGSADAKTMATGVSHAMVCTMTGLAVSISGLYPVHYFRTRARRETELLSDKLSF
ncbi:MAG TPA: MotA/TolQ/ExbB proton channel family protein [Candidatus Acidoferrum sp.]|nr:MotA/TolQ/ExbB proton channel family protein [Candidatus Acidoferrum sp.]